MTGAKEDGTQGLDVLPGRQFADVRRVILGTSGLDARRLVEHMFVRPPLWVVALMDLRNRLVRLVGLRPVELGRFPVIAEGPERMVLGLDDHHLDFRLVIEVKPAPDGRSEAELATYVRTRNGMGRAYLAAILPFHHLIARRTVRDLARRFPS